MKVAFIFLIIIQLITISISLKDEELSYFYKDYIKSLGYKLEEHKIITEDGYKLTLWHIVNSLDSVEKKVVYLQPGFTCTAWVFFQLEENSLPFILLENGYDVWIGNSRGTIFSFEHVTKDPDDYNGDYWDFSMDENVFYDLPASIDYVKTKTKQEKIHYIGHSQGTTIFLMLYMHNPTYVESSISSFISLGTVPSLTYTDFLPIKIIDQMYNLIEMTRPITKAIIFGANQRNLLAKTCQKLPGVCKYSFEAVASKGATNRVNYAKMFLFLYYYPGGTNSNTLLHWSQIHQEKKLVYFNPDYSDNKEAVEYDIEVIKNWKIRTFIQRSDSDSFSSYDDVSEFYELIQNKSIVKLVDTPKYGHTDDLAAESAIKDVYIPILNFIEE